MMRDEASLLRTALALLLTLALGASASVEARGEIAVLGNSSFWRAHFTLKPPVIRGVETQAAPTSHCDTPPPVEDWKAIDFDDRNWPRLPGVDRAHAPEGLLRIPLAAQGAQP